MYGISSFMDRLQNLGLLDKNLGLVYNIFGFINKIGGMSVDFDRIKKHANSILLNQSAECDYIEYKKSADIKDGILKTACAFANNYMNREIGLIFIGIAEVDDAETGRKAIPVRPISGIDEARIETTENSIKSILSHIHPRQ